MLPCTILQWWLEEQGRSLADFRGMPEPFATAMPQPSLHRNLRSVNLRGQIQVFLTLQAELDMSDWPRNWQAAVQRVLEAVLKLPEAALFAEPVPLDEVPGYLELILNPMDLGTVLGRAKADAYDTPLEALADVRQVGFLELLGVELSSRARRECSCRSSVPVLRSIG